MRVLYLLLAVVGITAGLPVEQAYMRRVQEALTIDDIQSRNSALENIILNLLEDLREIILNGNDDVPILDPLDVDSILLDDSLLPIDGHFSVRNLTLDNLSTFEVKSLSVNMISTLLQRYRIEFDALIPVLENKVEYYDLSISALGYSLLGSGDIVATVTEPRLTGNLVVAPTFSIGSGLRLSIISCEINFKLQEFNPEITGIFNDEPASIFVSLFLQYLVPDFIEFYEAEIMQFLSTNVQQIGNEILSNIGIGSILP